MNMSNGGYRAGSGRKKGSIPWNKGVPMKETTKKKVSLSKKGCKAWNKGIPNTWSVERMTGNNYGHVHKGRKLKPEWKLKMSIAHKGLVSPNKGKKMSTVQKAKLSLSRRSFLTAIDSNYDYCLDSRTKIGNRRIRRERIKLYGGSHTLEQWEEMKLKYNFTCPKCKRKEPEIKLTRDHIKPLSNKGTDNIENIQPLCNSCNARKATQTIKY